MPSKPKASLQESYLHGKRCAVCGRPSLKIVHTANLPDFVVCSACQSAFVVEDEGDRVMYGKINAAYPQTIKFAQRQWAWLDAVERKATSERSPADTRAGQAVPLSTRPEILAPPLQAPLDTGPDPVAVPTPLDTGPEVQPPKPAHFPLFDEALTEPPEDMEPSFESSPSQPFGEEILGPDAIQRPVSKPVPPAGEGAVPDKDAPAEETPGFQPPEGDPPPGMRYRIALKGSHVRFPNEFCAHCSKKPVRSKLAIQGTLPKGQTMGQRIPTVFNIPLCSSCSKRASKTGPEEQTARLQVFLISTLIALVVLVAALAWGIIDFQARPVPSALIAIILAALGFTLPSYIQLSRLKGFPLPPDAAYIHSTLLVPRETQGLETAFEWRSQTYAEEFVKVNQAAALGSMTKVKDRTSLR
ncbi:MAG: hypothetical protein JXA97_01925 [Anaerolineales bacterium]|nr:hypothetical protein [Anaerolineales bacterium]